MTQNPEPTEQEWRELARQAREEKDQDKLASLAKQIVEKYDQEHGTTNYAKNGKRKLEKVLGRITGKTGD